MRKEDKYRILQYLEEWGLLEYGSVIPRSNWETLLETHFTQTWDYLGPFLEIKEFLEENGYLCTTAGVEPGALRIYDADEMALRIEILTKNLFRKLRRLSKCMNEAKVQEFSEKEFKCHLHTKSKIQAINRSLESLLKDL
jgi:hypothetical protein